VLVPEWELWSRVGMGEKERGRREREKERERERRSVRRFQRLRTQTKAAEKER
jgi:hypothetical protein